MLTVQHVSAINDPPPEGGHVEGDWTVTDIRSYTSCTITLHGNLIIQNSLTFNNVTLLIQSDAQDLFAINVTGTFNVYDLDDDNATAIDASVISPDDMDYYFDLTISATAAVDMQNSIMRRYDDVTVLSSNVDFINNNFTDLDNSGFDIIGCAPTIRGNNVTYDAMTSNAFVFTACDGFVFEDNRVDHPWFHIIADGCEGVTFRNNTLTRGDRSIVVHETTATIEDNYFKWNGKTVVVEEGTAIVRRNTFFQVGAALATDEVTTNDVEAYDNHIEQCGEAFLLPGPGSESTARIHDNVIIDCWGAVGLFTGLSARIYDNHIEGCIVVLYTTGSASEFYRNTIINNSYVFYSRHSAVTEASNNMMANNVMVAAITEGSELTLENNVMRFNPMGIYTYERNTGGAHVLMSGNDMYDNPLFAIWNVDDDSRIDADNNYWGGVPNEDGDRIIGPNVDYEPYSNSPNDPATPENPFTPHIVTGQETYQGELNATGPWIVRDGGNLTFDDISFDLHGYFIGVKNGGEFTASGNIENGSAIALSSDPITMADMTISEMEANVLAFLGSPHLENLTIEAPNSETQWAMVQRSLIWSGMSDPTIVDIDFDTSNDTYAIFFDRSNGTVSDCTFTAGEGVVIHQGNVTIENSTFHANSTGLFASHCVLSLNEVEFDGVEVELTSTNATVTSNSFDDCTIGLTYVNGTISDVQMLRSSVGVTNSDIGIHRSGLDRSPVSLLRTDISFRNNSVMNSRLSLSTVRGVIANNTFEDAATAILVSTGSAHINYNNFRDNDVAISNTGSHRVNAVYNYWDSDDGPGGDGPGSGDNIHGDILHEPWATAPIDSEGRLLNFAPEVTLDDYRGTVQNSILFSGWAWDPDGDTITVEMRITGPGYDSGWIEPIEIERYSGWTQWFHLWDAHRLDGGTYSPRVRVSDGLLTTEAPDTFDIVLVALTYTTHSPIQINSDADLLNPANGVTGGSGSESDPYIIGGWEIVPTGSTLPAISIQNVQSHVVIEDCRFTNGAEDSLYIRLLDSPNVDMIRNCTFNTSEGWGISGRNDEGSPITMELVNNLFVEIDALGVRLYNYSIEFVENHMIGDVWTGGAVVVSSYVANEDATVRDNVCYESATGFVFQELDAEIHDNIYVGCRAGAMTETDHSNISVYHNLVANSGFGAIFNGDVPRVENNTYIGNQKITHYNGQNQGLSMILRNNTFQNNEEGVSNSFNGYTDARWNYWGASDGPSGHGSGSGDPVDDLTEYDPWHSDGPAGPNHPPRILFIDPRTNVTVKDEIEFIWYATDLDGDDLSVNLSYGQVNDTANATAITVLSNEFRYTWNVSGVPDGHYVVIANVTAVNASHQVISRTIIVDNNRPPSIEILEPDGDSDVTHDIYNITWSAQDPDGDLLEFSIFISTDKVNLTLVTEGLVNVTSYHWNVSGVDEGDYWILIEVSDGKDSASSWSEGPLTVDQAPSIGITSPPQGGAEADEEYTIEWTTGNASSEAIVDIYFDVSTSGSDLEIVKTGVGDDGSYEWDLGSVPNGDYYVYILLTDGAFTAEAWSPGVLTVDHPGGSEPKNHRPTIKIHDPDPKKNNTANEEFTITWTADDEDGDTVYIRLQYDEDHQVGGGVNITSNWIRADLSEWDWDTTDVPEGRYYIYAVVDDANGSQAHAFSDGRVKIVHPEPGENTAPTIIIDSPENGSTVNGTVWINGTAHDADGNDDIDRVRIRIDGGSWKLCDGTSGWSYEWDTSKNDNEEVTIEVQVEDEEGDTGSDGIVVTVDNYIPEPPWIGIESPNLGDTVSGMVPIWGYAGGDLELVTVTVTVDDVDLETSGLSTWHVDWNSSLILYDTIIITATVEDDSGATNSTSLYVTVNNTKPDVNHSPTVTVGTDPDDVRKGGTVMIEVTVDDLDGLEDIVSVSADLRDASGTHVLEMDSTDLSWSTGTVSISIDTRHLEPGTYILYIHVTDASGGSDVGMLTFNVRSAVDEDKGEDNDLVCAAAFIFIGLAVLLVLSLVGGKGRRESIREMDLPPPPTDMTVPPSPPDMGLPPPPGQVLPPPPGDVMDVEVLDVEVIEE